jgi:hypothetical protein
MGGITARRTSGHDSKQIVFPPCASHTQQTPAAGAAVSVSFLYRADHGVRTIRDRRGAFFAQLL